MAAILPRSQCVMEANPIAWRLQDQKQHTVHPQNDVQDSRFTTNRLYGQENSQ